MHSSACDHMPSWPGFSHFSESALWVKYLFYPVFPWCRNKISWQLAWSKQVAQCPDEIPTPGDTPPTGSTLLWCSWPHGQALGHLQKYCFCFETFLLCFYEGVLPIVLPVLIFIGKDMSSPRSALLLHCTCQSKAEKTWEVPSHARVKDRDN